ncbi:DPM2 domain-containing protein [Rhizoctonia solani AG-1 IA]|uniref:Dolichol phosphate-mannose biosynthesis regulatory protein n=1 Tax=Thanatephorus cucumeris (strain AG1-IA) TaxID=983506 RepID=L8X7F0_THACA|nr:DPM2 domain-containing protein [Rhizoctonia solani AG-1 IA]
MSSNLMFSNERIKAAHLSNVGLRIGPTGTSKTRTWPSVAKGAASIRIRSGQAQVPIYSCTVISGVSSNGSRGTESVTSHSTSRSLQHNLLGHPICAGSRYVAGCSPLFPAEHPLQSLFPPREWAVRLPAFILCVGLAAIGSFIGMVMVKEGRKQRQKLLARQA